MDYTVKTTVMGIYVSGTIIEGTLRSSLNQGPGVSWTPDMLREYAYELLEVADKIEKEMTK